MKKLINKLFEKLGYVPKKYKTLCEEHRHTLNVHSESVFSQNSNFVVVRRYEKNLHHYEYGYVVIQECNATNKCWPVKFFPENGDKDYAKLCAEELCEMLNEKY